MIGNAVSTVHLQTYIYEDDATGRMVAGALMRAARRKVKVFVLLDGYASQDLPKPFIQALKDAGIFFRWFWPLFKSRHFYLGRRMHHKILVTDGSYGLTGGVYSRDRRRLEQARAEFQVGNLYFNRKITGAMVGAQPFGGFNMSGTDSKAGGPDYLQLFLQAKVTVERF